MTHWKRRDIIFSIIDVTQCGKLIEGTDAPGAEQAKKTRVHMTILSGEIVQNMNET